MGDVYLDTIFVPLSFFLAVGYHAYLWHFIKNKPSQTTIGINSRSRKAWFQNVTQGASEGKQVLAVQSLRNTKMVTILTTTTAAVLSLSLAALTNNAFKARHLFQAEFFGLQEGSIYVLKYVSAFLLLLLSFLFSSLGLGFLIDSGVLLSVDGGGSYREYAETFVERGYLLVFIGSRFLWISFPVLLWMVGWSCSAMAIHHSHDLGALRYEFLLKAWHGMWTKVLIFRVIFDVRPINKASGSS